MAFKGDWKEAGGFNERRGPGKAASYQVDLSRASLFLKILAALVVAAALEFFLCGAFFRFIRSFDSWVADGLCAVASPLFCYGAFRELIRAARREKWPMAALASFFLATSLLLGCFFRYSLQLANGLLDFSDPETRVVVVTDRKTSVFGGSIREGPNPEAHLVYFKDWEDPDAQGEILAPPSLYYFAGVGTSLQLTYRKGFFHWPWMVDVQLLNPGP